MSGRVKSRRSDADAVADGGGKISRACDACRLRKVKCSGDQPCAQCSHLSLTCHFAPAPPKRKPGVRGRLVAQLRNQNGTGDRSPEATSPTAGGAVGPGLGNSSAQTTLPSIMDISSATSPTSVPSPYTNSLAGCGYSTDFFLELLPEFETRVYSVNPVLTPEEMRRAIHNMHNDYEDAALVHIFGAVTINLTKTAWVMNGVDVMAQMMDLMNYGVWAHRRVDMQAREGSGRVNVDPATRGKALEPLQNEMCISAKRVMTCIWIQICLMAFNRFDRGFMFLREAIGMVQMMRLEQYEMGDPRISHRELARLQRMYWEVYIHERFVFIMSDFPCMVPPLPGRLPLDDDSLPPHIATGYNRLILLFQIIDETFLAYWASQKVSNSQLPELNAEWIERKQEQLDHDEASAVEAEQIMIAGGQGQLEEIQHVDLFVTRLWMRTLVWQLALSRGLLRSAPPHSAHQGLSLHFPAKRLSSELRLLASRLQNIASVVLHGSGILDKLFEITSTVADVLALPAGSGQTDDEARARLDDFVFIVGFLFRFERTQKQQRDYLREKLDVLQKMYTAVDFRAAAGESPI